MGQEEIDGSRPCSGNKLANAWDNLNGDTKDDLGEHGDNLGLFFDLGIVLVTIIGLSLGEALRRESVGGSVAQRR
jgi:hypothetical protein